MKNKIIYTIALLIFFSCQSVTQKQEEVKGYDKFRGLNKTASEDLMSIARKFSDTRTYGWKDVDAFYHGEMQKYAQHQKFDALRRYTLRKIIVDHQLPSQGESGISMKTLFYTKELLSLQSGDVQLYVACFSKIATILPKDELSKMVKEAIKYAQARLEELKRNKNTELALLEKERQKGAKDAQLFEMAAKSLEKKIENMPKEIEALNKFI